MSSPPPEVLDLFAVPASVTPLAGGQGHSVVAGDLVLSPGRDATLLEWLSPVLARLAVTIDTRPGRDPRDLRLAMPVPARDGSWVVDGWAASRYEPGTVACRDLDVTLAAGRVLHAELASWVPVRPQQLDSRRDRWAQAERLAFADPPQPLPAPFADLVGLLDGALPGASQLVHADLAGNVLLDAAGAPVVIDLSPAWRPVQWAEAVCVLDAVVRGQAPASVLRTWTSGPDRQAMLRAIAFRVASDRPVDPTPYRTVLDTLG